MKENTKISLQTTAIVTFILGVIIFFAKFELIADYLFRNSENPNGELMKLFVQTIGGLAIIGTLWISIKRLKTLEKADELANKQFLLAEKGNITERFSRGIELLGNKSYAIRLGAIYALYQIAEDSKEYKETICEILCSYVREESRNPSVFFEEKREDFQAILNFFKIKNKIFSKCNKNLAGARLEYMDMKFCNFGSANFENAILTGSDLYGSNFKLANLAKVDLSKVKKEQTNFEMADMD